MPKEFKPVYFAHAVNSYNTSIEKAAVYFVANSVAGGNINLVENPNKPHHQKGYDKYAKRLNRSDKSHKGMSYFYDEVLPGCGGCVAKPFLDGKLGLGVAGETLWFLDSKRPAWLMEPKPGATNEDIEKFIENPLNSDLFRIRIFTGAEIEMLRADKDKGSELLLSHEETRLRTWLVYGKERRPYEEAHLVSLPIPKGFYLDK